MTKPGGIPDWALAKMPAEFREAILRERRRLESTSEVGRFNAALREVRAAEDARDTGRWEAAWAAYLVAKADVERAYGRPLTPDEEESGLKEG